MSQYKYDVTINVVSHSPEHAFETAQEFFTSIVELDEYGAQLEAVSEPEYNPNMDEEYELDMKNAGLSEYLMDLVLVFEQEMDYDVMASIINNAEEYYNEYISDLLAERVHVESISEVEVTE